MNFYVLFYDIEREEPDIMTIEAEKFEDVRDKAMSIEKIDKVDYAYFMTEEEVRKYVSKINAVLPEVKIKEEWKQEILKANKFRAIKIIRDNTGLGLKESKDYYESGKWK